MSATSEPTSPTQKSCPGLPGKGCGKFLASWDDHPLCTSCRRTAPEPCLFIFACPTCVDWPEEQRLRFNNRRTYRKKVPSSPPSDLGDLLVVDCATDPVPTEPITSPPPFPADGFHPDRAGSAHPGIPARGPLHPAVFPYGFPPWRKRGGTGPRPASPRPDRPPMAASTRSSPSDDEHLPPFPSCFPDFGGRSHSPSETDPLQPHQPRYTALSGAHRSPIAAPGAAHVHLHGTHGPSRAAPATSTWIRSDPATATVAHVHPARDSAATPLHGSQITAVTQPRGAFNITATTIGT